MSEDKIEESQIADKTFYEQNKKKLFCVICNSIILQPVQCSGCKTVFCNNCLFKFTMNNNTCPNGCQSLEILNPDKSLSNLFLKVEIICKGCNKNISLLKYKSHIDKCVHKNEKTLCFNCATEVEEGKLKFKNMHDFMFEHQFNKKKNFMDEVVFNIQIRTKDYIGFIKVDDNRLYATKEFKEAAIFGQFQIKGKNYIKVYDENKEEWNYLEPHYQFGIRINDWKSCGPITIDMNKLTMISEDGVTKGDPLCMRITDKKLYFYKEVNEYQQCQIKVIYID